MSKGSNLPANHIRLQIARGLPGAALGLLALALVALFAGDSLRPAHAQSCSGPFTIDFAGLPAGTIIDDQYAGLGVQISGVANNNGPDALIVFDSNSLDTDLDEDLRVGIGNIAIFPNNLDDDNGDGLVDRPDENNFGGRAIFLFEQDVSIGSFKFVDKDHEPPDSAIAYDSSGGVIKQVPMPVSSNGSVQTIDVDADGVRRFEVVYGDSGGFTGIEVNCPQQQTPTVTPVPPTPTQTPETETPTPPAATPTAIAPEETPTATPPVDVGTPTPTVLAAVVTPEAPTQAAAVAGESPAGGPATAVLGAQALPAGGGPEPGGDDFRRWAIATVVLALAVGASVLTMKRRSR
jgi:hypothetical protein